MYACTYLLHLQIDIGTVPIPKTSQPNRLLENFDIFNFQLSPEEIVVIEGLNTDTRLWRFEDMKYHQYYPF